MLENALTIMVFMWCISFSLLGVQYVLADVVGTEIKSFRGEPIKSHIVSLINEEEINERMEDIVTGNFTANTTRYDRVETYGVAAAFVGWELVLLLTGTYIFSVLVLLGVPIIFVTAIGMVYFLLLARAIVGYIRGV